MSELEALKAWKPEVTETALEACPDCEAGKHGICDGVTWDNEADDYAECPCWTMGHK